MTEKASRHLSNFPRWPEPFGTKPPGCVWASLGFVLRYT